MILWRSIGYFITFYHFDFDPRFPLFLLYVRWKSGVIFVQRCFRDGAVIWFWLIQVQALMRNYVTRYDTSCRPITKQRKQTRWSCFATNFGNFRHGIEFILTLKPKLSTSANLFKTGIDRRVASLVMLNDVVTLKFVRTLEKSKQ